MAIGYQTEPPRKPRKEGFFAATPRGTTSRCFVRIPQPLKQKVLFGTATRVPAAQMAQMEAELTLKTMGVPAQSVGAAVRSGAAVVELDEESQRRLESEGIPVFPDIQFAIVEPRDVPSAGRFWEPPPVATMNAFTMKDVMSHIRAPEAWKVTRGEGVTIGIVDTGICPTLPELPAGPRRSNFDPGGVFTGQHWTDGVGHGSMCAAIAAGGGGAGAFSGVAPDATVLACRTDLTATDIATVYGNVIAAQANGTLRAPLVMSNSWGLYVCSPPDILPADHPFMDYIVAAIDAGITVVFAAGNNHWDVKCNHNPTACSPTTIWGPNSHDRVISVGTVNRNNSNTDPATPHPNSSRGPGEWAKMAPKPDCVAPTYGTVVWGCGRQYMEWWGTSGACPQVAGLAGLLLSIAPGLSPAQVADIIRDTSRDIGGSATCVGHGLIDCEAAVAAVASAS